jgi:hypothetical protein
MTTYKPKIIEELCSYVSIQAYDTSMYKFNSNPVIFLGSRRNDCSYKTVNNLKTGG